MSKTPNDSNAPASQSQHTDAKHSVENSPAQHATTDAPPTPPRNLPSNSHASPTHVFQDMLQQAAANVIPSRRIPQSVWALGCVSLLMDVSSEMIHSLLPVFLVTALGTSAFSVGIIEGAAEATALIVKIFSGALSDYWGKRKRLAVLGYGLGAVSKPLFALATTADFVFTARILDRIGKGIRGAPRDALVADITPPELRGAAYGLRQSLDTVGAFLGPLLAMGLMLIFANNFRAVFWVAVLPACAAVALLQLGVQEPDQHKKESTLNPIRKENLQRLSPAYWWVVTIGALLALARFSEAFLILRATQGGLAIAYAPLVLIGMNIVYSLSAYPLGRLSDSIPRDRLLLVGCALLIAADVILAYSNHWTCVWAGISLWGLHLGATQGLLAKMVADTAPIELRGTAFGFFNLLSGIAILVASALAGWLWDRLGAEFTFSVGAALTVLTLLAIVLRKSPPAGSQSKFATIKM